MVVVCIVIEQDHPQCKLEKKKKSGVSGGPDSAVQPGTEQQHHSEAHTMQQSTAFVGFFFPRRYTMKV